MNSPDPCPGRLAEWHGSASAQEPDAAYEVYADALANAAAAEAEREAEWDAGPEPEAEP